MADSGGRRDDVRVAAHLVEAAEQYVLDQNAARGGWHNPRMADQPEFPWPDVDSPMLRYLFAKADALLDAGWDVREAMTDLAVHAWFEGGVAGFDRGREQAKSRR